MPSADPVLFRIAAEASEFEAIARLNYDTFVEEIPQHPPNAERRLVDRFHHDNTYVIAVAAEEVVGMIALRGTRPFSLDAKPPDLDAHLPAGRRVCELRLLAVRPAFRRGTVFRGLVEHVLRLGIARGYDLAVISGTVRQLRLYRHLGFEAFGPLVGTAEAAYQPMFLTRERFEGSVPRLVAASAPEPLHFLPGPVPLAPEVERAFATAPVYHREAAFVQRLDRVRARLAALVNAPHVQVLVGSGTLANDVVAAQLSCIDGPGVVASNGEFGERLIDHATRFRLTATPVRAAWGETLDYDRLETTAAAAGARWLWAVVSETSTGMWNDLDRLKAIARRLHLVLAVDAVSAVGAASLDLRGVAFASGASGKALASLPGLCFVWHDHPPRPRPERLPRYADLGYYAAKGGVPFTHSSNLVAALDAALARFDGDTAFDALAARSAHLRLRLRRAGFACVTPDAHATAAVVTLALPPQEPAASLGAWLAARGLHVAYQSDYLVARNWLQIAVMGACSIAHIDRLVDTLAARPRARRKDSRHAPTAWPAAHRPGAASFAGSARRQAPLY